MSLLTKYNVPVPRYTSYPTVPFWKNNLSAESWQSHVKRSFDVSNHVDGISIYIHLPFCESLCTYCACNTRITVNHKVEEPYINSVIKEWKLYLELFDGTPRIREIHLGGGTPTFFSPENLERLISNILSSGVVCDEHDFSFEAHPANTSEQHLVTLYKLGFRRVSFGIQDFDEKVQEAINRYQSFEEVQSIVALARKIGYESVNFDLVYGLPFQNLNGLKDTVEKIIVLRPDRIAFYSYAHVPWLKPGQRKFTEKDLPLDHEKRNLYEQGKLMFQENNYHEIGMDHFSLESDSLYTAARNNKLHRNFMGYTSNYTRLLVGLGVSSISDSWTAFAQNIKTVEEYQACVEKGQWPLQKGHELSLDDLMLRRFILNIMCHFEATWNEAALKNPVFSNGIKRLAELEADGLVDLHSFYLRVTEKGKPFLRNICMCFDDHYWNSVNQKQIFSSSI
jgi:oxygen-independent coproporphyrinogen-3 oxidase